MELKQFIREMIEEQFIEEDKSRLIDKLNITSSQKQELKTYFKRFPNREGGTPDHKIDWNKVRTLTWEDFEPILKYTTKTQKRVDVKSKGINGLKIDEDYIPVKGIKFDPNVDTYEWLDKHNLDEPKDSKLIGVYFPLNYEASVLIASKKIEGTQATWCTSWQKDSKYWNHYVYNEKSVMIYFVYDNTKYAMKVRDDFKYFDIWDLDDKPGQGASQINIPGIDGEGFVKKYNKLIQEVAEFNIEYRKNVKYKEGDSVGFYWEDMEQQGTIISVADNDMVTIEFSPYLNIRENDIEKIGYREYTPIEDREEYMSIYPGAEITIEDTDGDFTVSDEWGDELTDIPVDSDEPVSIDDISDIKFVYNTDVSLMDEVELLPMLTNGAEIRFSFSASSEWVFGEIIEVDIESDGSFMSADIKLTKPFSIGDPDVETIDGDDYVEEDDREEYEDIDGYGLVTFNYDGENYEGIIDNYSGDAESGYEYIIVIIEDLEVEEDMEDLIGYSQ